MDEGSIDRFAHCPKGGLHWLMLYGLTQQKLSIV